MHACRMIRILVVLSLFSIAECALPCNAERIWPEASQTTFGSAASSIDFSTVSVKVSPQPDELITAVFDMLKSFVYMPAVPSCGAVPEPNGTAITSVTIQYYPTPPSAKWEFTTNEQYNMSITETDIHINSVTYLGAIRALTTVAQLTVQANTELFGIQGVPLSIADGPSYPYRSVMLDVARRFQPLENLKRTIDGMFWSKLRVLHLHTYDDQSNPLATDTLGTKGAYTGSDGKPLVYTKTQILELQDYAAVRGVLVVPEFDLPGHSGSWSAQYPNIVVCNGRTEGKYNTNHYAAEPPAGALDIYENETFAVVQKFLVEMKDWWQSSVWHLGADELFLGCYNVTEKNENFYKVLQKFIDFTQSTVIGFGKAPIMWEDLITRPQYMGKLNWTHPELKVQSWGLSPDSCARVHKYGLDCITSPYQSAYLDCGIGDGPQSVGCSGGAGHEGSAAHPCKQWCPWNSPSHIYSYDFLQGSNLPNVIGGGTLLWTERVPSHIQSELMWPRAAIAAERLWQEKTKGKPLPADRVELQKERLMWNGVQTMRSLSWIPSPENGFSFYGGNISQWCNVNSFNQEQCKKMI